jgi:hypothetical protein
MLKKSFSGVLSPVSPCDIPSGYASVAPLPAALLDDLFEHPAREVEQVVFDKKLRYS